MLAIDFGTSFTTAAVSVDGRPEMLEIENSRYFPSVVVVGEDGGLVTGRAAAGLGGAFPERAERLPKRALIAADAVRLGDRTVSTIDLAAAVLGRVATEARRRFGTPPSRIVLTHPARWGEAELDKLRLAAAKAELTDPELVPEPVAAAVWHASRTDVALGKHVAVYDFGGGTFDTAVLTRTADGFSVLGAPGGDPHLGGEDLDEALLELVADHARRIDSDGWERLWAGTDRAALRNQYLLRRDITDAKETLSRETVFTVYPPGFTDGIRITRTEFEHAIADRLTSTVDELKRTVQAAGLQPSVLAAVYLTGGSSRVPRASDLLAVSLGTLAATTEDPKAVVALGALHPHLPASAFDPAADGDTTTTDTVTTDTVADSETVINSDTKTIFANTSGDGKPSGSDRLPPSPPEPRSPAPHRRRQAIVTGIAALIVVAALIPAIAIKATSSSDSGSDVVAAPVSSAPVTPSPTSSARATSRTTPQPTPTTPRPSRTTADPEPSGPPSSIRSYQKNLYNLLNPDEIDLSTCKGRSDLESAPWNADAAISCETDAGATNVHFLEYDSSVAMDAYLDRTAASVSSSGGACNDGEEMNGTWHHENVTQGRKVCIFLNDGDFQIAWAFRSERIVALRVDDSATAAATWWKRHSCVIDSC